MKKVLNLIAVILLIAGAVLGTIAFMLGQPDTVPFFSEFGAFGAILVPAFLLVGALLSRGKNVARTVGRGLVLAGAAIILVVAVQPVLAGTDLYMGHILGLVAAVLVLLHFIFVLLADRAAENDEEVVVDEKIALIYRYKDLMDDGIITKEEFNAKKAEIMAPAAKPAKK